MFRCVSMMMVSRGLMCVVLMFIVFVSLLIVFVCCFHALFVSVFLYMNKDITQKKKTSAAML